MRLPVVFQAAMGRACRAATQQGGSLDGAATWPSHRRRAARPEVTSLQWALVGALGPGIPARVALRCGFTALQTSGESAVREQDTACFPHKSRHQESTLRTPRSIRREVRGRATHPVATQASGISP